MQSSGCLAAREGHFVQIQMEAGWMNKSDFSFRWEQAEISFSPFCAFVCLLLVRNNGGENDSRTPEQCGIEGSCWGAASGPLCCPSLGSLQEFFAHSHKLTDRKPLARFSPKHLHTTQYILYVRNLIVLPLCFPAAPYTRDSQHWCD